MSVVEREETRRMDETTEPEREVETVEQSDDGDVDEPGEDE